MVWEMPYSSPAAGICMIWPGHRRTLSWHGMQEHAYTALCQPRLLVTALNGVSRRHLDLAGRACFRCNGEWGFDTARAERLSYRRYNRLLLHRTLPKC